LITPHNLYVKLGKTPSQRQARYRALFDGHMPQHTLDEIRSATNKAWVLGDVRFKQQVEEATGRAASPRKRGGDRKSEKFWEEVLVTLENS
jgi:putative transposase